jgi:UDPglucose--hexose-1-phosphate uridylyltransferase
MELREDPIAGHSVIIAENRAARPNQWCRTQSRNREVVCPFCEGRESFTTPEVWAIRDPSSPPDSPGWRVRVIPNKYPALTGENCVDGDQDPFHPTAGARGFHEVVVESSSHLTSISELNDAQMVEVAFAYRDRIRQVMRCDGVRHGLIFKNSGAAAGASLEHVHSQLMATSFVPLRLRQMMASARRFWRDQGICFFCELTRREVGAPDRVVLQSEYFLVLCPFASRFAFEMCLWPKEHQSRFETMSDDAVKDFACILRQTILRLEAVLDEPAYNYLLRTSPFDMGPVEYYHWHVEVLPRVSSTAGFEWGTGYFINPVSPEDAAAKLRSVSV